jgi:amino acid transporter
MTTKLRTGALSLAESVVMGVAGSAPGFSVSVALIALIGSAGLLSPGALIIFAIPMIGIAVAYKGLGARMANAGAGYEWTSRMFGKPLGFASGWALLVAAAVFTVTGSSPLGAATLSFFAPHLADNVVLATAIGAAWFVAICIVLMIGIELTSKVQLIITLIQLTILTIVLIAAAVHAIRDGAVNLPAWQWFSLDYPPGTLASTALLVVFFYWGWDVTANLSEETTSEHDGAGTGGFLSVFVTASYFVAFAIATLVLFDLKDTENLADNLVYHIAEEAGLGRTGALAASFAVILSSVAAMETLLLQFSRTLFAMGRDGSLPRVFGVVHERTRTPMNAMYLILGLGLVLMFLASFMSSIGTILATSVTAISLQVSFYYGLAGLACAWLYRDTWRTPGQFLFYVIYPLVSAVFLGATGVYAFSTFDTVTRIVGLGGLLLGMLFFRPKGYGNNDAPPRKASKDQAAYPGEADLHERPAPILE